MFPINLCLKHLEFMDIDYSKDVPELYCKLCEKEKDEKHT